MNELNIEILLQQLVQQFVLLERMVMTVFIQLNLLNKKYYENTMIVILIHILLQEIMMHEKMEM